MFRGLNYAKKETIISVYLIVALFFLITSVIILNIVDFEIWASVFSVLLIITILFQVFCLRRYIAFFSFAGLFLTLSYLFHFGELIVLGFCKDPNIKKLTVIYLYHLNLDIVKTTAIFCYAAIEVVVFGVLLVSDKKNIIKKLTIAPKKILFTGIVFFLLFSPFVVIDLKKKLIGALQGGYHETFNDIGDGSGIISFLVYFFYYGLALIVIYFSTNKKNKKAYITLFVILIIMSMYIFTGGRGTKIIIIIFFAYISYKCQLFILNKFKIFLLICTLFFGVVLVITISLYRGKGINSEYDMLSLGLLIIKKFNINVIFLILNEIGGTIYTPYLTIAQAGAVYEIDYGLTYIKGLINLFPNVNGTFSEIINAAYFPRMLKGIALGGSFIGESYFNFGYAGLGIMVFIGIYIGKISQKIEDAFFYGNYIDIIIFMPMFLLGLWWVRDAFFGVYRIFIYGFIFIKIVDCILNYVTVKKSQKKLQK